MVGGLTDSELKALEIELERIASESAEGGFPEYIEFKIEWLLKNFVLPGWNRMIESTQFKIMVREYPKYVSRIDIMKELREMFLIPFLNELQKVRSQ